MLGLIQCCGYSNCAEFNSEQEYVASNDFFQWFAKSRKTSKTSKKRMSNSCYLILGCGTAIVGKLI